MSDILKKAKVMTKVAYLFLLVAIVFFILQFNMPKAGNGWMGLMVIVTFIIYIVLKYKARGMVKKAASDQMTK